MEIEMYNDHLTVTAPLCRHRADMFEACNFVGVKYQLVGKQRFKIIGTIPQLYDFLLFLSSNHLSELKIY